MTTLPTTVQEQIDLTAAPPSAPPSRAEASLSFNDIMGILKRRTILITILFLLFSSMAIGGWLVAWHFFPLYGAEAFVECISDQPKQGFIVAERRPDEREQERFMQTQAHHAKHLQVLMETLKTPEVRSTQWFNDTPDADRIMEFEDLIKVGPLRGTNLLRISCRTHSKNDPHIIVNQLVTHYLRIVKDFSTSTYSQERKQYEEEVETIATEIQDKQQQLGQLGSKLPPGEVTGVGNIVMAEYSMQRAVATQYELETQELEGLYNIYNQSGGAAVSPEDTQMVEMDPQVAALSNQMFQYSQQLEVLRKRLGPNHRQVQQIEDYLDVVRRQAEETRQRRLLEIMAYKKEQVKTAYLNSQHSWLLSREKLADLTAKLTDMDAVKAEWLSLSEDIMLLKQNEVYINQYIRELDRVVTEREGVRVEWRNAAMEPLERNFPQKILIPVGVFFSLFLAIGVALMIEFVDTSIRTPQDIIRHVRAPLLGVVPDADDEEVTIEQVERAVTEAPHSMFAESLRSIRTNLQFAAPADRQRSLIVTSPRPDDGKTTIACNLAAMVAQGGRRVLLVDANFRRPAIHRFFPVKSSGGLSNILIGSGTVRDYLSTTGIPNLDVLGAGPMPPSPAELVSSQQMRDFVTEVTGMYDQVILDAPPILLATDAALMASRTDGAIVVLRANMNSRGIANRSFGMIRHVNAHLFGTILNAAQIRRGGYFREQLRTFYDYRLDEDEDADGEERALPDSGDIASGAEADEEKETT